MPQGPERIDYRETSDITEVHGAIRREHSDPRADVTPIPMWLTIVCGVCICWAGTYLGVFHGGFSPNVFNERESSPNLIFAPASKTKGGESAGAPQSLAAQGKSVYSNCMPCHQANGMGLPGQFPPLVNSEWAIGGEKRFIAILLKGLQGPITAHGANFNGVMPPWEGLPDKKIAAVASYVRSSWGNSAGEISEAKVAGARKEFASQTGAWTVELLNQIPPDANFPDAGGPPAAAAPATGAGAAPGAAPAGARPATVPGAATPAPPTAPAPAATSSPPPQAAGTPPAPGAPAAVVRAAVAANPAIVAEGKKHYMMVCVVCHQPTGLGLPLVFPPLVKTEYVMGSPERLVAMVLKGNAGPITVDGKPYNNIMPGQELMLDDAKIAAILTFVRSEFGNKSSPVDPPLVAATRKKFAGRQAPWTEAELKAWKDDGLPGATPPPANPSAAPPVPATTTTPAPSSTTAAPPRAPQ